MCSALHYKSFLMHGIQTLLKPLRWSSLLFPLPPSYFHHSISTMLFQNSLRLRKDKRSTKKSIFSRQNIFIVTFWKCFEWVQPGNHFKGILFLLQKIEKTVVTLNNIDFIFYSRQFLLPLFLHNVTIWLIEEVSVNYLNFQVL